MQYLEYQFIYQVLLTQEFHEALGHVEYMHQNQRNIEMSTIYEILHFYPVTLGSLLNYKFYYEAESLCTE